MIQWMLAIWSLVPLSLQNTACIKYIWKFSVHVLLKPSLKDFEYTLASMWNECNCIVIWTFFGIFFLWHFPVLWPLLSFPNQLPYWVEHFDSFIFRIWNSSAEIPSLRLTLLVINLPEAHLTSHSRLSCSRWVTTLSWLSGSLRPFLYSYYVYSCQLFLISSASVISLPFLSFIVPILAWNSPLIFQVSWRDLQSFSFYQFPLFICIVDLRRPSYLSLLFSGTLNSVGYIFYFLSCLFLLFFPQLFVKPLQTTTLLPYFFFFFFFERG